MVETWLQPNRRVLCSGCVMPFLMVMVGSVIFASQYRRDAFNGWLLLGACLVLIGGGAAAGLMLMLRQPRMSRDGQTIFFHLGGWSSIHVPMETIDCFFLGEGSSGLGCGSSDRLKASHLVIRFAEKAVDWHNRDVKPSFGKWQDGYLSIYGTWCESLDEDLVRELNRRLAVAKRTAKETA